MAVRKPAALSSGMRRQVKLIMEIGEDLGGPTVPITVLEAVGRGPGDALSRVGGPGVDLAARQPKRGKRAMTHLITLATADVPALAAEFPSAAAVALYLCDPDQQDGEGPDSDGWALVPLTGADIARGLASPGRRDRKPRAIAAETIAVPAAVFGEEVDEAMLELRGEIHDLGARAGGAPTWIQDEQPHEGFLLQLRDAFLDIDMGDEGVLYVCRGSAFWQV